MLQQSHSTDSLSAANSLRQGLIWLPDSTQPSIDSSYCLIQHAHGLDSLLYVDSQNILLDSSYYQADESTIRTSILEKQALEKPLVAKAHMPTDNLYLSLFIVFGFFVVGAFSYPNRKSFSMLLKSLISTSPNYEIMRDRSHITGVFFTAPFMLALMLSGVFISYTIRESSAFTVPVGLDVVLMVSAMVLIQVSKNILLKTIGNIFETQEKAEEHILYAHQFFCFSSWIYLPALTIALALPVNNVIFFHIFLALNISLSVIYTTLRLVVNYSFNGLTSIGLFILYICCTEIIPVLLILKTIYLIKD